MDDELQPDDAPLDPPAEAAGSVADLASVGPEVHAAAILAAKDLLLTRPELPELTSDTAALTIGMHAAIIVRSYQEFLHAADLLPPPLQGR